MPTLKTRTETIIKVDYNDLDTFIKEVTGQDYECVAAEEWGNGTEHRFIVDGEQMDFQKEDWESFKGGKKSSCALSYILNGLCADELIPPGKYLISVCW